jgi:hypothetical protein
MLGDNRRFRLDNILMPPYEDQPAIDELKRTFLNSKVTVYTYSGIDEDPNKDEVPFAHIVTSRGVWVQQELISKGLAWAFVSDTGLQTVGVLKQAEESARARHLGFWRIPAYAVKTPGNIKDFANSYQIVEGRILNMYISQRTYITYLYFGKDFRTDFVVRFRANDTSAYKGNKGLRDKDPVLLQWKGHLVRVRGWVSIEDESDRPVMDLTHREQLDILPEPVQQQSEQPE